MHEPLHARPCADPHSAPVAWLRNQGAPEQRTEPPSPEALRGAIELILAHPDAVVEIITRAPPEAFTRRANPASRHDGWTGERMALFLETLADTGIVTEACRSAGMNRDGAYSFRNRDPVFAAAWRAAEGKARPHVSDALLERSITGTVEHFYRDGILVGERRHYESWLGLAVLKRLDKLAEDDRLGSTLAARMAGDWRGTLDMLRRGGTAAVPAMLAPKVDKIDTPPSPPGSNPHESCWRNDDGAWMTTFPPPLGFDGDEKGTYDGINAYERACTAEEAEALEAHCAAEDVASRADDEAARDAYFQMLRDEAAAMMRVAA